MKNKSMKSIPEAGVTYICFDDGKVTESRKYHVHIESVIRSDLVSDNLIEEWMQEVKGAKWLYSDNTDYFVIGLNCSGEREIFVRTVNGGWFSFSDSPMTYSELDVDGSLSGRLKND